MAIEEVNAIWPSLLHATNAKSKCAHVHVRFSKDAHEIKARSHQTGHDVFKSYRHGKSDECVHEV